MANTTYQEVIDSFESSFQDKVEIPESLEMVWFNKAVGKYSFELEELSFDETLKEFSAKLDRYAIDTLGTYMKRFYMERELSKVNKRASIVTKELSINGSGSDKNAVRRELEYVAEEANRMTDIQKSPALS